MSESREENWEALERTWRAREFPVPAAGAIRRRLGRKRLRLAATWVMDAILTAGLIALMIHEAITSPGPRTWVLASAVFVLLVIALAFSVVNRRGLWRDATADLDSYVRHGLQHCRSRLRTVQFAWWLFAAEVIFIAGYGIGFGLSAGAWAVIAAGLGGFALGMAAWTAWFRRRVLAERDYLAALSRENGDPGEAE